MTSCEQGVAAYQGSGSAADYTDLRVACGQARTGMSAIASSTVRAAASPLHPRPYFGGPRHNRGHVAVLPPNGLASTPEFARSRGSSAGWASGGTQAWAGSGVRPTSI